MPEFRWKLADDDGGQPALFADEELVERHIGKGEFRGLEFFHVNAKRVINEVPAVSRVPFRYTINAYRGCSHACAYCVSGDTPVLMADGRTRPMAELQVGDAIYGTVRIGNYRRYVPTTVLDHWSTVKPAYRVTLEDGTELIVSGDHRFLSNRGWKHVTGAQCGPLQRPHLTLNNKLLGTGGYAPSPKHDGDYRLGYLTGMIRGDGTVGSYHYERAGRTGGMDVHRFRLALVDDEGLARTAFFLDSLGIPTRRRLFQPATATRKDVWAIVASSRACIAGVRTSVEWPANPSQSWSRGFLAGVFDAEGSYSQTILRFSNKNPAMLAWISDCLLRLGFRSVLEPARANGCRTVRIVGGLREHLRFFHTVDPTITRKRTIDGVALKSDAKLGVVAIEPLGFDVPMYDITTGTGDYISNGVVSHNCFARPTHEYLGFNIGEDFERKLVVKVNAVERLRAELRSPKWRHEHIAMGTNTDPYQRAEGKYHLTRGIVEALGEAANPFSVLTKSTLILRDLDVLTAAAESTHVRANFSIGTLDEEVWKATEPGTPHPRQRVAAVRKLNEAGIPCGVLVAPVLPGMSDRPQQLQEVVEACAEAGATSISAIPLHLRSGVKDHFMGWLAANRPDLVPEYEQRYRNRGYLPAGQQAEISELVADLVERARARYGTPAEARDVHPAPAAGPERSAERQPEAAQLRFGI